MAESSEVGELYGEEDCITPPAIQLACPSCKTEYNDHDHRPKLLSCDHTVCKACLTKLAPSFECPHCRQLVSTRGVGVLTDFAVLHALTETGVSSMPGSVSVPSQGEPSQGEDQSSIPDSQHGAESAKVLLDKSAAFEKDGTRSKNSEGNESARKDNTSRVPGAQGGPVTAELPDCPFEISSQSNSEMVNELLKAQFQGAIDDTTTKLQVLDVQLELVQASKEKSIVCIDEEFDHLIHMINRRRNLLKSQIGDIHSELKESLEEDSERLNLNLMCLKSLSSHAKLMMKGRTDRLQSTYHQISSEIMELQENVEQVSLDGAVCIEFETKDKIKDFERSIRLWGKVQTGANIPTSVKILDNNCEVGKDSAVTLSVSDGTGVSVQSRLWHSKLQCQIYGPDGESIETHKPENESDAKQSEGFLLNFVPFKQGEHCVKIYFCDRKLPVCVFEVA